MLPVEVTVPFLPVALETVAPRATEKPENSPV